MSTKIDLFKSDYVQYNERQATDEETKKQLRENGIISRNIKTTKKKNYLKFI